MRPLRLLVTTLLLLAAAAACGGGGSPSPIYGSPAVTSPASPLPSPAGTYNYGY